MLSAHRKSNVNWRWSIINDDYSYVKWVEGREFSDMMEQLSIYGFAEVDEKDSVWTCTPGSVAEMPEGNELYDRKDDPFQQNNLVTDKEKEAREMFEQLMAFMTELRVAG